MKHSNPFISRPSLLVLEEYLLNHQAPVANGKRVFPKPISLFNIDIFSREVNKYLVERNSQQVTFRMIYILNTFSKGLLRTRKGKLTQAQDFFALGKKLLDDNSFEAEQLSFLLSQTIPNLSYYYYVLNDFEQTEVLINEALRVHEAIEETIHVMHMGKIQQLHNIIRVYFKSERVEEALLLTNRVLNYLAGHESTPYGQFSWGRGYLINTPIKLLGDMFFQVFLETTYQLMKLPQSKRDVCRMLAFSGLEQDFGFEFSHSKEVNQWLRILTSDEFDFIIKETVLFCNSVNEELNLLGFLLLLNVHQKLKRNYSEGEVFILLENHMKQHYQSYVDLIKVD